MVLTPTLPYGITYVKVLGKFQMLVCWGCLAPPSSKLHRGALIWSLTIKNHNFFLYSAEFSMFTRCLLYYCLNCNSDGIENIYIGRILDIFKRFGFKQNGCASKISLKISIYCFYLPKSLPFLLWIMDFCYLWLLKFKNVPFIWINFIFLVICRKVHSVLLRNLGYQWFQLLLLELEKSCLWEWKVD